MNLETEIQRELWQALRRSYESSAWSNAILDAVYFLSDAIRAKTDLQSDGTALAGQAFGGKSPKLRLNRLETESDQNIQQGVEQLVRGTYQAIRNPRSHGRIDDTQADADAIILFVSHLLRLIGHARTEFALDICAERVLEKNFVPSDRYAQLLVAEIPQRQRLQVALTVYHRRTEGEGDKLGYFFSAILAELSKPEKDEFFAAVSNELRETSDDKLIRTMFQCLCPTYWPHIDEIARLRIENRIVRNIEDGLYDISEKRCSGGALATWARSFFPYFSMKDEAMSAIVGKLRSRSSEEQDYVFNFFFSSLDLLAEKPTPGLTLALFNGLKSGDERFLRAINSGGLWNDEKWSPKLKEAIENFELKPVVPEDSEEVPF
ncbi:TIGR02391 family protein [Candidatus Methylomirabilis sp.]|uniref:TIGR02391 family protein n=1 Tax=Candidatus Methylomirabilis sp. TaxID=2032687 RepID=UPI003076745D